MTIQHLVGTLACACPQRPALAFMFALVVLVGSGGCSQQAGGTPCIDSDRGCGMACNSTYPCPTGLYCGFEKLCGKDCAVDTDCPSSRHCNDKGQCAPGRPNSSTPQTAGMSGGAAGDDVNESKADAGSDDFVLDASVTMFDAASSETCQAADVAASRVIPNVILVIDQSSSMNETFGAGSRWDVLRDSLLRPDGLIAMFESRVRFGLSMYSALEEAQGGGQPPPCPMVTSVAPMLMNFAAISSAYNAASPIGETPTGDSIDAIVDSLPQAQLDQTTGPTVIILATDGEPDRCEQLNPQEGQAEAVAAVARAFDMNVRTYIISVGSDVSEQHQQDVANAGLGLEATDMAPYWRAGDDASLREALTEIIGAQVSCEVALEGSVQSGDPCLATVELNSTALACNDGDGWELADENHIRLLGKACSDWKTLSNAALRARFPCDVTIVF
jgi:Mg-chelatase subunit ChlD